MTHLHQGGRTMMARLGKWLVEAGDALQREAEKRALAERVARRLRAEGIVPGRDDRRAKDIAAEEMTAAYREKYPRCECDGGIHGEQGCQSTADQAITRSDKRLKVCGNCTLTGDTDRTFLETT